MSLLNVTRIKKDTPTNYYVSYDAWNGEITSIGTSEKSDEDYIVTVDPAAGKILAGKIPSNKYIVSFDDTGELLFLEKDNVIRLRSSENRLHQIPKHRLSQWDIRLKLYKENHKLLIEISTDSLKKLTSFTYNKHLSISKDSDLTIYVIRHNNPDFLITSLEIDPIELLENGNVIFDISKVTKYTSYDNIGFVTRRCFKNYYAEIVNDKLINTQKKLRKYKNNYVSRVYKNQEGHLELTTDGTNITVQSLVKPNELGSIGLYNEELLLHVVGSTPDEYITTLVIDLKKIYNHGKYLINSNVDIRNYNLIHNKPNAKITLRT
jgi:hypothetical protein